MRKNQNIVIIGSGFSSLAASCYLAKAGYSVTIVEKNFQFGGRARQIKRNGFTFDMGPTFYWMPDVFEQFFNDLGKSVKDYYELQKLNPAYRAFFKNRAPIDIEDSLEKIISKFEEIEAGSGIALKTFIDKAKENYELAIRDLVYQPGESIKELATLETMKRLPLFIKTIKSQVAQYLNNKDLKTILEFPVLFLGGTPHTTPAFYNFMNYADFGLGTWHPVGGMHKVIEGMVSLARSLDVKLYSDQPVLELIADSDRVQQVVTSKGVIEADIVLSGADYQHTEQLLQSRHRQYSNSYWSKKTYAPSALLYYVAFDKTIDRVAHHSLFFDADFEEHAKDIYDNKKWPEDPLFYASFPSKTDSSMAPKGKECAIFLIPIAPDLKTTPALKEKYFDIIMNRLEKHTGRNARSNILFKEVYSVEDFKEDYNSYKGNAYGLANTLFQTHILRPKLKSKKLDNLYFTGQLTVPGPGVPPSLISGKIVSDLIIKYHPK